MNRLCLRWLGFDIFVFNRYVWFIFAIALSSLSVGCGRYYHVTETYRLSSANRESKFVLAVLTPVSCEYQKICNRRVLCDGKNTTEQRDDSLVYWLSGNVSKTNTITIEYDVILNKGKPHIDGGYTEADISPAPKIESDHPLIIKQAQSLVKGKSREDVYRIFKFVGKHLSDPPPGPRFVSFSALEAYKKGEGVCSESARLMIALCRAAGIPTREVSGLSLMKPLLPGTSATARFMHTGIAHAWIECFVDGKWQPFDPTLAGVIWGLDRAMFTSHGYLLYYDRYDQTNEILHAVQKDSEKYTGSDWPCIGAMYTPLRFAAYAPDSDCNIAPVVKTKRLFFRPADSDN